MLCFCLIAATLFGIFGLGRPNIAVAIALDLSSSTYQPQAFNAPGTIMQQEVAAVKAYLEVNSKLPSNPNTIQVFGIGGGKDIGGNLGGDCRLGVSEIMVSLVGGEACFGVEVSGGV